MNDFNFPYVGDFRLPEIMFQVIMSKIKKDNSIDPSVNYAVTRKNEICRYSYYTTPVECDENTLGFVAQVLPGCLLNENFSLSLIHKILQCNSVLNKRLYCVRIPEHSVSHTIYGSAIGGLATAAPATTPVPTTPAPPPTRGYAFIIDTRGGDPNLFAMSQVIPGFNIFTFS